MPKKNTHKNKIERQKKEWKIVNFFPLLKDHHKIEGKERRMCVHNIKVILIQFAIRVVNDCVCISNAFLGSSKEKINFYETHQIIKD